MTRLTGMLHSSQTRTPVQRFREWFVLATKARQMMKEAKCNALALRSLFDSALNHRSDVQWLFILTFPNGGSTALAKLLLTAAQTTALTDDAEGQWLIPSLSRAGDRWNERFHVSERKIRAVWLNKVRRQCTGPALVVEKSPPNMCRFRELLSAFEGMKTYLMTFSRDPYATCASWHRRYGPEAIVRDWKPEFAHRISNEGEYFEMLGDIWIERAKMLYDARERSIMNIRYEDFAEDTPTVLKSLGVNVPQLRDISPTAEVRVKDYQPQAIVNMNEKQIALLSKSQMESLSRSLARGSDMLKAFGYEIRQ